MAKNSLHAEIARAGGLYTGSYSRRRKRIGLSGTHAIAMVQVDRDVVPGIHRLPRWLDVLPGPLAALGPCDTEPVNHGRAHLKHRSQCPSRLLRVPDRRAMTGVLLQARAETRQNWATNAFGITMAPVYRDTRIGTDNGLDLLARQHTSCRRAGRAQPLRGGVVMAMLGAACSFLHPRKPAGTPGGGLAFVAYVGLVISVGRG